MMENKDITTIVFTIAEVVIIIFLLIRAGKSTDKGEKRFCYAMMVLTAIMMALFMQKTTLVLAWW